MKSLVGLAYNYCVQPAAGVDVHRSPTSTNARHG
jgi:hypothetical protein